MSKEKIMYAVFRKEKDDFPEVVLQRARDAKQVVGENKKFWWGKTSYQKRVVVRIDEAKEICDIVRHTRIVRADTGEEYHHNTCECNECVFDREHRPDPADDLPF